MSQGSFSTIGRLEKLLATTNLNVLRFSTLCQKFGLKGVSDASITRALQRKRFSNDVDQTLQPFIIRIENLIKKTELLSISFQDIEHIEILLRLLEGVDIEVKITEKETNSDTEGTTILSDNTPMVRKS
jgi:hypothetical protein